MGFEKTYLPDLEELKKLHSKFETDEEFLKKLLGKSEVIIGPNDSHRYINEVYERVQKNKKDHGSPES